LDDIVTVYGGSYYFEPNRLQEAGKPPLVGPDPGCNVTREWSTRHGGLDYNETVGEVILTAREDIVVRGASITSEIREVDTPGDLAICPVGGPLGAQYLFINLDDGTV